MSVKPRSKTFPKIDSSRMQSVCPLLVPLDSSGCRYDGFITAYGREFRLKIQLPANGQLSEAVIEGDISLIALLGEKKTAVQQRLKDSRDLPTFLDDLKAIIENEIQQNITVSTLTKTPKYYSKLVEDIDVLGWHRLVYVDKSLNEVHVKFTDQKNREHILRLKFPPEYPECPPTVMADLPRQLDICWSKTKILTGLCEQFEQHLSSYQKFWDVLDEVDREMWVLEPDQPSRSDATRRIALGKGSSLMFTVDPQFPNAKPVWLLLGSDKVIEPLQERLNMNFDHWNEEKSIVENWKTLLAIEIPSPMNTKKEDVQSECGICYAYKLNGAIPDRACEDHRCKQVYHAVCLDEWLRALPTSRCSFNTVFGECPYCNKVIACKAPNT